MGKCVMAGRHQHGTKREEGPEKPEVDIHSFKRFQKVGGVLAISVSSSLSSAKVLETLDQHRTLLERAIARSHGYKKVTILGMDSARRLRDATSTQARVRFEAEVAGNVLVRSEDAYHAVELEKALQEAFVEAGLDFQVQKAAVVITSNAVSTSSSQGDDIYGFSQLSIACMASGLAVICTCTVLLCLWRRRSARSLATAVDSKNPGENNLVVAPVVAVVTKDKDLSEIDADLASISTGTPSSHGEASEP